MKKNDLKVFVSDEIFDFRSIEDNQNKKSAGPLGSRSHSFNPIHLERRSSLPPTAERQSSSAAYNEQIPKAASYSSTYSQQKLKKSKPKNRSRTVDPRFRRSRSPNQNQMNESHSANVLTKTLITPSQSKTIKPYSASSPTIRMSNNVCEKTYKIMEHKKRSSPHVIRQEPRIIHPKELTFMEGQNSKDVITASVEYDDDNEDDNQYLDSSTLDCVDNTDELFGDSGDNIIEFRDYPVSQIPYWDDPRVELRRKYGKRAPILTPFLLKKSPRSGFVLCRKSDDDNDRISFTTYKYDDITENCSCAYTEREIDGENKYSKDEEPLPALHKVVGSVFAVIFCATVIWLVHLYFSWSNVKLWQEKIETAKENEGAFVFYTKYVVACIVHTMDVLCGKFSQLLWTKRKEIFKYVDEDEGSAWLW